MPCPIWGTPAEEKPNDGRDGALVSSPRTGGEYFISGTAVAIIENCDDATKARLTSKLVEERHLGNLCPEVTATAISEAKLRRSMSIDKRVDGVLLYFESKSEHLGSSIQYREFFQIYDHINLDDLEVTYFQLLAHSECVGTCDLEFLLHYLMKAEMVSCDVIDARIKTCTLSVKGYARLDALRHVSTSSSRAFVAMWFDASMAEAWEHGFKPAVEEAGYEPVRIDKMEHINKIDDEIIAEIRKARFLVADFTHGKNGARGGVYYEAGFARGLGIPVISTCRQNAITKVHFDTRQYNHILWDQVSELRDNLRKRIEAVIGEGPMRNK